jgi:hypothetical protein
MKKTRSRKSRDTVPLKLGFLNIERSNISTLGMYYKNNKYGKSV